MLLHRFARDAQTTPCRAASMQAAATDSVWCACLAPPHGKMLPVRGTGQAATRRIRFTEQSLSHMGFEAAAVCLFAAGPEILSSW